MSVRTEAKTVRPVKAPKHIQTGIVYYKYDFSTIISMLFHNQQAGALAMDNEVRA